MGFPINITVTRRGLSLTVLKVVNIKTSLLVGEFHNHSNKSASSTYLEITIIMKPFHIFICKVNQKEALHQESPPVSMIPQGSLFFFKFESGDWPEKKCWTLI